MGGPSAAAGFDTVIVMIFLRRIRRRGARLGSFRDLCVSGYGTPPGRGRRYFKYGAFFVPESIAGFFRLRVLCFGLICGIMSS